MKTNNPDAREIILQAMKKGRITRYELSKRTGIDQSQLKRFLSEGNDDLKHMSGFNLMYIFEKVGIGLAIK